jgi:hypothetical protein
MATAAMAILVTGHVGTAYGQAGGSTSGRAPPSPAQTAGTAAATAALVEESKATLSGKAAAPFDVTGNWVSLVTSDWQFRMVVPGRGEYQGIPLNVAGKERADAWDPKRDEAMGKQCGAYGAGVIMLIPGRLRIDWTDDDTLRVQTDAGTQTRLLRFRADAKSAPAAASWQGDSRASWMLHVTRGTPGAAPTGNEAAFGSLRVATDHMLAGLIRKNGVAYSERSELTEYWDLHQDPVDKRDYLIVTASLHDPELLRANYNYVATFVREADASKWDPTPCSLTTAP